jgi:hypothetical protein
MSADDPVKPEENHEDFDEIVPQGAEGTAAAILTAVAVVLLVLAPFATKPQPADKGWYLAPINWPVLCLLLSIGAGAVLLWRFYRYWQAFGHAAPMRSEVLSAFDGMRSALEYSAYFGLYLVSIAYAGFGLSTIAFLQFVVWRAGLRTRRWAAITFLVSVGIILIFRVAIDLWFPLAPLFKLFPPSVANTLGGIL